MFRLGGGTSRDGSWNSGSGQQIGSVPFTGLVDSLKYRMLGHLGKCARKCGYKSLRLKWIAINLWQSIVCR